MAARLIRLLLALGLLLGAALPSAASVVVRAPTSQETAASTVPDRRVDPAYARSYFGARYYRSDIGRFTTVDPVLDQQAALTDPQRWNRYAYVRNNPLRYTDPDGRQTVKAATASEKELIAAVLEARKEYANSEGLAKVWAGVKLAWAESAFMPFTPTAMGVEGVAAVDLAARAKAIHGAVGVGTQGRTTIAVARVATSEGGELILVGSSKGALRPAQRALLQAGEQAVKGPGHAEVAVINAAQASGATVKEIAASRPICPKCNEVIRDIGAAILSVIK